MKERSAFLPVVMLPHRLLLGGCLLLALWGMPVQAKNISYRIDGISGDLKENVETHLAALPSIQPGRIEYRGKQIRSAVEQGLQALGYYQSRIQLQVDEQNPALLHVQVTKGKPVTIRTLRVQLLGDALNDE
nr:hypothetical protein [Aeromonadaceae bacterium]